MHWRKVLCLVLSVVFTLIAGCGKHDSGSTPTQKLVIGAGQARLGLDPLTLKDTDSWLLRLLIYEPLIYTTPDFKLTPGLAVSWEVQDGGKKYVFRLREGVRFHDGTPFTADAVKQAFERSLQEMRENQQGSFPVEKIEVLDERTVAFFLSRPWAPFLRVISSYKCVIPSPAAYAQDGTFVKPIGTGPFKVEKATPEEVILVKNEAYWNGAPKLQQVVVKAIPDHSARVAALEAGEIDVIGADMAGIPFETISHLEKSGKFKVIKKAGPKIELLGINSRRPALEDVRVRQAICCAVDRQALVESILYGYGVPAKGPIGYSAEIPWCDPSIPGYDYDLKKAKELLQAAGYKDADGDGIVEKDGKPLRLSLVFSNLRPYWKPLAEILQSQLSKAGMAVELKMVEWGVFQKVARAKDFDLAIYPNYGKDPMDPYLYFLMFFTSKGSDSLIQDPQLDELTYAHLRIIDETERQKIYNQMQQRVMELAPAAFLYHPMRVVVMKKDVEGWRISANEWEVLSTVKEVYRKES